jgi:hypothetical protein
VIDVVTDATVRRRLLVGVGVIAALGLFVEIWTWRSPGTEALEVLWPLLSLSAEHNLPTWVASALLLCCALRAGAIARALAAGAPWRRHWWGIAFALGFVSLDEVVGLHEQLGGTFGTGGVLYFDWVLIAGPVVAILAVLYLPFLRALRSPTRERLVIAAVIFVTGALVMELPLGWWTERMGPDSLGYALIDWIEETLELVGTALALASLLAHPRSSA